ncbi:hypothetical protein X801_03605, partial [Opisthorchis viverrini]
MKKWQNARVGLTTVRCHTHSKVIRVTLKEPFDQLQLLIPIVGTTMTPTSWHAKLVMIPIPTKKSVSLHSNTLELTMGYRFQEQSIEVVTTTLSMFLKRYISSFLKGIRGVDLNRSVVK